MIEEAVVAGENKVGQPSADRALDNTIMKILHPVDRRVSRCPPVHLLDDSRQRAVHEQRAGRPQGQYC